MKNGMPKKKKKRGSDKSRASFKQLGVKSDKLSDYKYDQKPSVLMRSSVEGHESPADRELRRLMHGDVFRSSKKTVKESNQSSRRYD